MIHGIDASSAIDWTDYPGLGFAAIKATEGTEYISPAFRGSWTEVGSGVPRIAYHYGRPSEDPAIQAAHLTSVVRESGLGQYDHFALDLEIAEGMTPVDVSFWGWVFCTEVNRLNPGHRVLVYTMPSFADQGYCAKLGAWNLWVADWGVTWPSVPLPWKEWMFWQYASAPAVDYDMFCGGEAGLRAFMSHAGGA